MRGNTKTLNNTSVQAIFDEYIHRISTKLKLLPLIDNIIVILGKKEEFEPELSSPRGLAIIGKSMKNQVVLKVSPKYPDFIPMILLREAYLCFLHESLRENKQLQFFIYMLIELDLSREQKIEKWKAQIRKIDVFTSYFNSRFDSMNRFFQFKFPNSEKTIVSTFFHYLRNLNIDILQQYFYPTLMRIYINGLKEAYKENEELIETISILDKIFNEVKSYRALLDYKKYYKEFKENGNLQTSLSLRKFISNVRWISRYSFCSPIYLLDWNTIGLSFYIIHLRFHPTIAWHKVNLFLKQLPFVMITQFLISGFSREYFGYIIIPTSYLRDIKHFFDTLLENGFLITAELFLILKNRLFFNLNYLLMGANNHKFIPKSSKSFTSKFLLESRHPYTDQCIIPELELLDFLILERARQVSITGFGFERRESTLSTLRDDYLSEISKQNKIILKLREILKEVSQSVELREKCVEFIGKNKKYGFFTLYDRVSQINYIIVHLKNFLLEHQKQFSIAEFLDHINSYGFSSNISQNLFLKNSKLKKYLIQRLYPLYLNNRLKFSEEEYVFTTLLKMLDCFKDLKLYDMKSIQDIVKDSNLFELIYHEKEKRIKKLSSQSPLTEITSNEVESRLEKFSSATPPVIIPCLMNSLITLTIDKAMILLILHSKPMTISKVQKLAENLPSIIYYEIEDKHLQQNLLYCALSLPYMDLAEQNKMLITFQYLFEEDLIYCTPVISPGITPIITRREFYDFISKQFFYTPYLFENYLYYSRFLFGDNLPPLKEHVWNTHISEFFDKTIISNLITDINSNRKKEILESNILNDLGSILDTIEQNFLNEDLWTKYKKKIAYTKFIKTVKFEPFLSYFGLRKYYIYFRPLNMDDIDLKLLLSNSFLSFHFYELSKTSHCFMIKYIFPYNNPNLSYLNWLMLSKRNISEYCLFTTKVEYMLHNLSRNIEHKEGVASWNLDISQFINYTEEIIFSSHKNRIRTDYNKIYYPTNIKYGPFDPQHPDFLDLASIYPHDAKNLKYIKALPKDTMIYKKVKKFLKKKQGYLKVHTSNLQLHQKVVFILPSINTSAIEPILEIFKFFNKVKISIIEGEYYLHSFLKVISFEQGLCIKIWFPDIDIDNFINYLSEVFTHFDVPYILMYTVFYNGTGFLNKLFRGIDLKNDYNPLLNFEWNPVDKIWMTPKLFTEEFKPIYPSLVRELDSREKNDKEENSIE